MKIAVVIPAFNAANTIARTVASARGADELIVVNDGSNDTTSQVLARLAVERLTYIEQPNRGQGPARNRGSEAASADAFVFLDADDELVPGALEHFKNAFARSPRAQVVVGGSERVIDGRVVNRAIPRREWVPRAHLVERSLWPIHAACIRRQAFEKIGGFRSRPAAEDWELFLRLALSSAGIVRFPDLVARYWLTPGGLSQQAYKQERSRLDVIKEVIDDATTPKGVRYAARQAERRLAVHSFAGALMGEQIALAAELSAQYGFSASDSPLLQEAIIERSIHTGINESKLDDLLAQLDTLIDAHNIRRRELHFSLTLSQCVSTFKSGRTLAGVARAAALVKTFPMRTFKGTLRKLTR